MDLKLVLTFGAILLICVLPSMLADVNMSVEVSTGGGDANIYAYSNTGNGTTTYYINGNNVEGFFERAYEKMSNGLRMRDVYKNMYKLFMEYTVGNGPNNKWIIKDFNKLSDEEKVLRWVMDTYFVPRAEINKYVENLRFENQQLRLEIDAIEKLVDKDELCMARMAVALENGIKDVKCNPSSYHYSEELGFFVSLESLDVPINNTIDSNETGNNTGSNVSFSIDLIPVANITLGDIGEYNDSLTGVNYTSEMNKTS